MKRFFLTLILPLLLVTSLMAQGDLMIKKADKGLYVEHKVAAKQSLFALGRMYNVHPKMLASFNKIDIAKGLVIGQPLRIPLTDTNFIQKGNSGTPVYYKPAEKESLSKISSQYHVSAESLREWNGLDDETVSTSSKVVVGFIQSKELPSVTLNPSKEKKEVKQPDVAATPVVEKKEPAQTVSTAIIPTTTEVSQVKAEEAATPKFASQETSKPADLGYFQSSFDQQARTRPVTKDLTVTSGVFKTTSGWIDSKYYLLIDGVQPGTIVKISNPTNNRIIYAKVLGEMSGIRQNEGLAIRISSAAVSALQVSEPDKFILKINY